MEQLIAAAISTCNLIGEQDAALENMETWIQRAAEQGVELVLFPELNVSGYFLDPLVEKIAEPVTGPSTERAIDLAGRYQMTVAFGLIERAGDRLYCTHVLVNGQGMIGKQRKVHTPAQEQAYWGCGNEIQVFDIGGARVGITVCRDG